MWHRMSQATGKTLSIGIGCRRHISADQISAAVHAALGDAPLAAIRCIATIESKAQEPGLLEFCARHALPLQIFSRAEIARASRRRRCLRTLRPALCPRRLPDRAQDGARRRHCRDCSEHIRSGIPNLRIRQPTGPSMKTDPESHLRMTQRRREGHEKKQAEATIEKGLLIVNTGTGKGKTTAAFGMAVRVLGHGMRLGVVQFIKGALHTSERDFLGKIANCDFVTMGDGYTWNTQNRDADIATARKGWDEARRMIESGEYQMVILDELNTVLKYEYLPLDEVLSVVKARPEMLHVVITGRHAPDALIEAADLVTEMRIVKHPYREQHVKAQRGVEF
jgi:cob(I)alamin adenosyltransferase